MPDTPVPLREALRLAVQIALDLAQACPTYREGSPSRQVCRDDLAKALQKADVLINQIPTEANVKDG